MTTSRIECTKYIFIMVEQYMSAGITGKSSELFILAYLYGQLQLPSLFIRLATMPQFTWDGLMKFESLLTKTHQLALNSEYCLCADLNLMLPPGKVLSVFKLDGNIVNELIKL